MSVLLAMPNRQLQQAIRQALESLNLKVDSVFDGLDAYHYLASGRYEVGILNQRLSSLDGTAIAKRLQDEDNAVVIFLLSEDGTSSDIPTVTSVGPPIDIDGFVHQVLRKVRYNDHGKTSFGDLILQGDILMSREQTVLLSNLERQLMTLLLNHRETPISKQDIRDAVPSSASTLSDNSIQVHLSHLRNKLKQIGSRVRIKTSRNIGYRLDYQNDNQ